MSENYSDQYIEQTFYLWYKGGRKISNRFANSLPEDEKGQRPTFKTVEKWRDNFGWIDRADKLDADISNALQKDVINERIEMYREHVEVANALITKGKEFLDTHEIDDMADALKALSLGIEIARTSVGQAALGHKILAMSDDQLTKELSKLLAPEKKNEEFIDAETEEEPSD